MVVLRSAIPRRIYIRRQLTGEFGKASQGLVWIRLGCDELNSNLERTVNRQVNRLIRHEDLSVEMRLERCHITTIKCFVTQCERLLFSPEIDHEHVGHDWSEHLAKGFVIGMD
jgi:hypothetical protein